MKQEFLAQMIGALDDDLIAEANQPLPRVHRTRTIIFRWAAVAACFAAVLAVVWTALPGSRELTISIGGTQLSVDGSAASVPLVAVMQSRSTVGTELALQMDAGAEEVTVTAGANSVLLSEDGSECTQCVCSGRFEQLWLVDTTAADRFELVLRFESRQFRLTAVVDDSQSSVLVTMTEETPAS